MRDGVSHLCHTEPFRGIAASIVRPIATASEAQSLQRLAAARRAGAPGRTRTCDPRLRRPVLYPTELRAPMVWKSQCSKSFDARERRAGSSILDHRATAGHPGDG
jgi:hypothetical protein